MIRIPLFDDAALLLNPRWGAVDSFWHVLFLLVILAIPVALVGWLYRYELRLVSRRAAAILVTVRLLILLALLTVICLQPVVARYSLEEQNGSVILAVDRSRSMDFSDPQRTPVEKLRLARALKSTDDAEIDRWLKYFESGAKGEPPNKASLEKLLQDVDGWTRSEIARKLLTSSGLDLAQRLTSRHPVEIIGFDRNVQTGSLASLFEELKAAQQASRFFTDIGIPLSFVGSKENVLGVVVFSDGQHNFGPMPTAKARELAERGMPIYPVAIGSRRPPVDISVRDVQAPANTFPDAESTIEAHVHVTGVPADELQVELHQAGKPLKSKLIEKIKHDGSDRAYPVRFRVRLDEVGTHFFQLKALAESQQVPEISQENNSASAVTRVVRDKAKVLLVDGEARWEYHYLSTLLSRDKELDADRVVFQQPRIGQVKKSDLKELGFALSSLPSATGSEQGDPLLEYDGIVLGDVTPAEFPLADRRRLEHYVARKGGTLILVAGKRGLPLAFLESAQKDEPDPFVKLIPIMQPRVVSTEKGFKLELTREGQATSFLQLEPDRDQNARRWAEFPPHYWGIVGKLKPGARALANASAPAGEALVVEHNYGFGRVLYIGLDTTWRWRYRVGDTYHHRFWGQLLRWAAADNLLPAGNEHVRFGTRDPVYSAGKEVQIGMRLSQSVSPPKGKATAHIMQQHADGKETAVAEVPLIANELQPRLFEGRMRELPPGQYRIVLDVPELKDKIAGSEASVDKQARRDGFTVSPPDSAELADLATNWTLLEALANQTKGELLTPETAHKLVDLFERRIARIENRTDEKLWQDSPSVWFTLGALLFLLTLEWTVRKWAGLP